MPATRKRYNPTEADERKAARLKQIYLSKKDELGITQVKLGEMMGMSQGNVANYFRGALPMNVTAVMKFAQALQVDPYEIDPDMNAQFSVIPLTTATKLGVLGTMSGAYTNKLSIKIRGNHYMNHHLAILVDTDAMAPVINKGATFVVDPQRKVSVGDYALIQFKTTGAHTPYTVVDMNDEGVTVVAYMLPAPVIRRKLSNKSLFPKKSLFIPIEEITAIRHLLGLSMP